MKSHKNDRLFHSHENMTKIFRIHHFMDEDTDEIVRYVRPNMLRTHDLSFLDLDLDILRRREKRPWAWNPNIIVSDNDALCRSIFLRPSFSLWLS